MKKKNMKNIFIIVLCVFVIIPLIFILFDISPHMYKEGLDGDEIADIQANVNSIESSITDIQGRIDNIDDDISGNIVIINEESQNINQRAEEIQNTTLEEEPEEEAEPQVEEPFGFSVEMKDEDKDLKPFQIEQVRINGISVPGNSTTYNKEQESCNYYIGKNAKQPNHEIQNINGFEQNTYTYTYL